MVTVHLEEEVTFSLLVLWKTKKYLQKEGRRKEEEEEKEKEEDEEEKEEEEKRKKKKTKETQNPLSS
ncbi:hypothetical protein H920_04286 [Fukomys damarensis]|uniref:Uncharacterized protein n=1 Tax=Fukomys damarensis TaxID=885580 RepID=A0A091DV06_FUKDA|nr:hypothetical protein H920_04286 [Fukomys damarensis]